jgi:hypothetical protein
MLLIKHFSLQLESSSGDIILAKVSKTPVLLNGGKDGIVVVGSAVNVVGLGNDTGTNKNRPNLVFTAGAETFVPGKQDSSALVESSVGQKRLDEALEPGGSSSQAGVVTIVVHVRTGC